MVQVSSPTVRVAKSDVQVGLGEVVPRSIMFDHTIIRGPNIDFQKIGSHSTFGKFKATVEKWICHEHDETDLVEMGEVLLPPGNFLPLPLNCTRQTFIQQYQWQTSWEGCFFCTSHSRLRVGTSKSSMILGCHVFVSRSRVNTAPDMGETQSTCQRWRLCKIQIFSAQCVRSRWSKIEHGNHFNREQV